MQTQDQYLRLVGTDDKLVARLILQCGPGLSSMVNFNFLVTKYTSTAIH